MDQYKHTRRASTLLKNPNVTFQSQFSTTAVPSSPAAAGGALGSRSCSDAGRSRILEPELPLTPGLTLERQNGPSGCERASPCQSQLAFSCIQMRQTGRGACPLGHPLAWEEGVSAPWVSAESRTSFPGHAPLPRPGPRSRGASPGTSVPEFRAALSIGASASSRTCRVPGSVSSPLCESGTLPLLSGAHTLLWLLENRGGGGSGEGWKCTSQIQSWKIRGKRDTF